MADASDAPPPSAPPRPHAVVRLEATVSLSGGVALAELDDVVEELVEGAVHYEHAERSQATKAARRAHSTAARPKPAASAAAPKPGATAAPILAGSNAESAHVAQPAPAAAPQPQPTATAHAPVAPSKSMDARRAVIELLDAHDARARDEAGVVFDGDAALFPAEIADGGHAAHHEALRAGGAALPPRKRRNILATDADPIPRPILASDQPVKSSHLSEIAYYVGSVNRVRRLDRTAPRARLGLRDVAKGLLPAGASLEKLVGKIMRKKNFDGDGGIGRCAEFIEREFLHGKWHSGDILMFE